MPRYDYQCPSCNHRFELKQGFDADPIQPCPVCNRSAQRRIYAVGVIYKGSGWYTTDYARSSANFPSSNGSDNHDKATPVPPSSESSAPKETLSEAKSKES
ncbi:MAG: hypothetical protein HYY00_09335 [Chloroflexi bacterium]|nr:hypothetical protein [Chloroflexota bacterium]